MKFKHILLLAAVMSVGAPLAMAEETVMDTPLAGSTLLFADRFVSAFYTVNEESYEVVVTFATGLEGSEQPIQQTIQLEDGQTYRVSIGGFGGTKPSSTLSMTRKNNRILADVTTAGAEAGLAN